MRLPSHLALNQRKLPLFFSLAEILPQELMHSHEFLADPIQLLIFSRYLLAETRRLLASPNQYVLGFRYTQAVADPSVPGDCGSPRT